MTPQQHRALTFIKAYRTEHGFAPSYGEIAKALGLASKSGAYRLVDGLIGLGLLRRTGGHNRAIEIVEAAPVPAWFAIETAPKDGTPILVARHDRSWGWIRGWARYVEVAGIGGWIPQGFFEPPGCLGLAHPTHWQPIPDGPTS